MIRLSCARTRGAGLQRTNPNTVSHPRRLEVIPTSARVTRRWTGSSSSSVAAKTAETPKSIPGPNWLWLEPIYGPFRAYGRIQQRRPYTTQFVSSLVIYFVGDMVAQSIGPTPTAAQDAGTVEQEEERERGWVQAWSEERDWARTGRALIIGGAASLPAYRWFLWLGNSFNYGGKVLSLTTKVTVNQLLFTPIFNSYFFGMQSLLSGASVPATVERIKNTVPTSWINSCKVWPAITAFMFVYVPIQYRSIFGGVIAIGWQTYLSILNQRAAAVEKLEREGGEGDVQEARSRTKPADKSRRETRETCAA